MTGPIRVRMIATFKTGLISHAESLFLGGAVVMLDRHLCAPGSRAIPTTESRRTQDDLRTQSTGRGMRSISTLRKPIRFQRRVRRTLLCARQGVDGERQGSCDDLRSTTLSRRTSTLAASAGRTIHSGRNHHSIECEARRSAGCEKRRRSLPAQGVQHAQRGSGKHPRVFLPGSRHVASPHLVGAAEVLRA